MFLDPQGLGATGFGHHYVIPLQQPGFVATEDLHVRVDYRDPTNGANCWPQIPPDKKVRIAAIFRARSAAWRPSSCENGDRPRALLSLQAA